MRLPNVAQALPRRPLKSLAAPVLSKPRCLAGPGRAPKVAWADYGAHKNPRRIARSRRLARAASSPRLYRLCREKAANRQNSPPPRSDGRGFGANHWKDADNIKPKRVWPDWEIADARPAKENGCSEPGTVGG